MDLNTLRKVVRLELKVIIELLLEEDDGNSLITIIDPPRQHFAPFDWRVGPQRERIRFPR